MGLFDNIRFLNELVVNNQEQPEDNKETSPTDYTATNDNQQNNQPAADTPQNDPPTETDDSTDYTQTDTGEGDAPTETPAGNPGDPGATDDPPDDTTDYTQTDTGDGGTDSGATDDGTGDPGATDGDPGTGDDTGATDDTSSTDSGGDTQNPDEIKKLEDELFANFSPEQIGIKNKELKNLYIKLFDTTDNLIGKINDIPKIDKYLKVVEFISIKVSEARNMIIDYMNHTYNTNSYTVNLINYNKFLAILHGVNKIIEEIKDKDEDKDT